MERSLSDCRSRRFHHVLRSITHTCPSPDSVSHGWLGTVTHEGQTANAERKARAVTHSHNSPTVLSQKQTMFSKASLIAWIVEHHKH
ncbi:hypothetical protein SRHO_G00039500 [Serrasalmus rhombeus]